MTDLPMPVLAAAEGTRAPDDNESCLPPYYVYELRARSTNEVFYVGKGSRLRVFHHAAGEDDQKARRIMAIEAAGDSVRRVIVGRFATEAEAFAVESVLIKWVYGIENLTNRVLGHRAAFVRDHRYRDPDQDAVLPGIDVERPLPRQMAGAYTAAQRQRIMQNAIPEKLSALRVALLTSQLERDLEISDADLSDPANPCLWVRGFSDAVRISVAMQLTGERVKLGLVPADRSALAAFDSALLDILKPYTISNAASTRRYAHTADFVTKQGGFPGGIPVEDTVEIARQIAASISRLNERR
jgi:hypothetical protein